MALIAEQVKATMRAVFSADKKFETIKYFFEITHKKVEIGTRDLYADCMSFKDSLQNTLGQFFEHEDSSNYPCSWGYGWNTEQSQYVLTFYYRNNELPIPGRCIVEEIGPTTCRVHTWVSACLYTPAAALSELALFVAQRNGARKIAWRLDQQGYRATVLPYPTSATCWFMTSAGGVILKSSSDCYVQTPLLEQFRTMMHELTYEFALVNPVLRKIQRGEWTATQAVEQLKAEETAAGR